MSEKRKQFKGRDEIIAARDLKTEEVWVEDWDTWVLVRKMPGDMREEWERVMVAQRDSGKFENVRAIMVSMTLVDSDGNLLFPGPDGVAELSKKAASALDTIFVVAQRLNKMTEKDIQDLEKN